jgi:hypothetical protein
MNIQVSWCYNVPSPTIRKVALLPPPSSEEIIEDHYDRSKRLELLNQRHTAGDLNFNEHHRQKRNLRNANYFHFENYVVIKIQFLS